MSVIKSSHSSGDKCEMRDNLNKVSPPHIMGRQSRADSLLAETESSKPTVSCDIGEDQRMQSEREQSFTDIASNSPSEIVEVHYLFKRFLGEDKLRKGLRIQFDPRPNPLFGGNWATMDLGKVESNARQAGKAALDVEDEYFDMVFCSGLDRVSRPSSLIAEMRRALKRRGQIWAQSALWSQPDDGKYQHNRSFWYVTPEGFQILFETFDEIACSCHQNTLNKTIKNSYFYGIKPEIASDSLEHAPPYLAAI
jgi:hypothetical protein